MAHGTPARRAGVVLAAPPSAARTSTPHPFALKAGTPRRPGHADAHACEGVGILLHGGRRLADRAYRGAM